MDWQSDLEASGVDWDLEASSMDWDLASSMSNIPVSSGQMGNYQRTTRMSNANLNHVDKIGIGID